jgi:hypothetical protein
MKDENMKNAVPIVINEEYLGGNSTREQAVRVVEILTERGYDVSYGVPTGYGENAQQIPDSEWNEVLTLACNTINADTAPAQAGSILERVREIQSRPSPETKWRVIHLQKGKPITIVGGSKRANEYRLVDEVGNWLATGQFGALTRACQDHNSTPALLAALTECMQLLANYPAHDPNGECCGNMVPECARAAIAQAEKEVA